MKKEIYILNFSGGKDSTAMLLKLLEEGKPIDYVVFSDTGAEYPEIYRHISEINRFLKLFNKKITIVRPKLTFIQYVTMYKRKRGKEKGLPYGFPTLKKRWCTGMLKIMPINEFKKSIKTNVFVDYIGYTIEERNRARRTKQKETKNQKYMFPLIDWNMSNKDCLHYCYKKGFYWGGLYKYVDRASCYLCPFQRKKEFLYLINLRPELWAIIKDIERGLKNKGVKNWRFSYYKSTAELEKELKIGCE